MSQGHSQEPLTANPQIALDTARVLLDAWFRHFRSWGRAHLWLGITSILLGSLTTYFAKERPDITGLLGVASSFIGGVLTFTTPSTRARGYITAWRLVRDVYTRVQSEPGHAITELNDAIDAGEGIIRQNGG
jgi:hypothetical protein